MTVTVYRSTDAGAPTLSGVRGSLINVLSACLVDGYGSKASAGWTKPYSIADMAAFKMPIGSNGHFMRVEDPIDTSFSRIVGFTEMTGISTGVGRFPAPMQGSSAAPGNTFYYRSAEGYGSTTSVPWILVTNGTMLYFWSNASMSYPIIDSTQARAFAFGQIDSKVPLDKYGTVLINQYSNDAGMVPLAALAYTANNGYMTGHYIARNYTQAGVSAMFSKCGNSTLQNSGNMGSSGLTFPNPADGKIYVAPTNIFESTESATAVWRGSMPGLYSPCFRAVGVLNDGDIISDIDGLPDKVFEAHYVYSTAVILFEISDTW